MNDSIKRKAPLTRLVPFLLLSLLGCVALHAQPTGSPDTIPIPVPRADWLGLHKYYNSVAQKGGIDVLFVGDSITYSWKDRGKVVWQERFVPLKAENFGIPGDKTQHVLWRLQNGNLDGIHPKVVVLMVGTNNIGGSAKAVADGITAIVKEINVRQPSAKVLLLAVFPRGETPDFWGRKQLVEVNAIIAKLHDGKRVFFLDIGQKFLQPDGRISKEIMPDFLHPSPAGYQIWADAIQYKLAELLK